MVLAHTLQNIECSVGFIRCTWLSTQLLGGRIAFTPMNGGKSMKEMNVTMELAGWTSALAVRNVSKGEALIPVLCYDSREGRKLAMFPSDQPAQEVEAVRQWISTNPENAERTVLVYDAYYTFDDGRRTDALIVEIANFPQKPSGFFKEKRRSLLLAIPYRNAN